MLDLRRLSMSWIAVAAVAIVPAARAGNIQITVSDGVSTMKTYTGDSNSDIVTGTTLNADFHGELKKGSSISATSNFGTADSFRTLELATKLVGADDEGNLTFTIKASQTDFVVPLSNPKLFNSSASLSIKKGSGLSVSAEDYVDSSNVLFGMGVDGGPIGPFTAPNNKLNDFSGNGTQKSFSAGVYSLTDTATQMITSGTTSTVDTTGRVDVSEVPAVPEPTTLLSLLAGLPALGVALARRCRKA